MIEINERRKVFSPLGASNHSKTERDCNDYYATDPQALELLLDEVVFSENIWECACGEGHLSKVLEGRGYNVLSTDLVDRGYGKGGVDFLQSNKFFIGDIITNPPYKYASEFVEKAIESIPKGNKVAMLLRVLFLEGKKRKELFKKYPPRFIYISSSRISCALGGNFEKYSSGAQAYAWFIWEKGFQGPPIVRWFN